MSFFSKYFVPTIEIIGGVLFTIFLGISISDKYFDTQYKETLSQNRYVSHFLGLESEEQFETVNQSDPFFIALKKNISQVLNLKEIETIKVQKISDNQKKFYINTKKHQKKTFLVQKVGKGFKVSIKK